MGISQGGKGAGGKLRPEKENINTHVWGSRTFLSMWEKKRNIYVENKTRYCGGTNGETRKLLCEHWGVTK